MTITTKAPLPTKLNEPKMYLFTIILQNHVSWDFCMGMLEEVFRKSPQEAEAITHELHRDGEAICGAYPFEIAETKAEKIEREASNKKFTLQCLLEEV